MQVELNIPSGDPNRTELRLEGKVVPFMAADLHIGYNRLPTLEVKIDLYDVTKVGGEMNVVVPSHTHELLVALGWTPPKGK
jgi:hypothetical protein